MAIYIINFFLILLYNFIIKNKKTFVTIVGKKLFLILALRNPMLGVDNATYAPGYEFISKLSFGDLCSRLHLVKVADLTYPYAFESGYVVLNWIVSSLGIGFHGFLVLHAAFCTYCFSKFIDRYSENPCLSFLLFIAFGFFTYQFGILRQTLSMAIFVASIPLIQKRKPIKYFLLCFLSFTIHRIAIITLPLYFVYNIKLTQKRYVYLCLLLAVMYAISPLIVSVLFRVLSSVLGKTLPTTGIRWNTQFVLMIFFMLAVFVFADFEEDVAGKKKNNFLCWCFLFSVFLEIFGLYNDTLARAVYVPYLAIIILIPNVLKSYERTTIGVYGKVLLVFLSFVAMVVLLKNDFINPYVFYLN